MIKMISGGVLLQVISPELTFYTSSSNLGDSLILSNKLLHSQLDAFCRLDFSCAFVVRILQPIFLLIMSKGRLCQYVDFSGNIGLKAGIIVDCCTKLFKFCVKKK